MLHCCKGRVYEVITFDNRLIAQRFIIDNPEWGVLEELEGVFYLSPVDSRGVPLAEILSPTLREWIIRGDK